MITKKMFVSVSHLTGIEMLLKKALNSKFTYYNNNEFGLLFTSNTGFICDTDTTNTVVGNCCDFSCTSRAMTEIKYVLMINAVNMF